MYFILPILCGLFTLGVGFGLGGATAGASTVVAGLVAAGVAAWRWRSPLTWCLTAAAAATLAGLSLGAGATGHPQPACYPALHTGLEQARVYATVLARTRATRVGLLTPLQAHGLVRGERTVPLCGEVQLSRAAGSFPLHPGEQVLVRARLRPVSGNRNPGAPGADLLAAADAPRARLTAGPGDLVVLAARPPGVLAAARVRILGMIQRAIADPSARAIVAALVVGDRSRISDQQRLDFSRAGASHLLAISGLHLALVAMGVMGLARRALLLVPALSRGGVEAGRLAVLPGLAAALGYTALTGAAPPTVRACVLVACLALAHLARRGPDLWRPLSLAALALLAARPENLLRPGFQLSFMAVAGIALAVRGVGVPRHEQAGFGAAARRWLVGLCLASAAATLVTAPLVARHFSQVTVAGLAVNLLAIPWTSFVLLPVALAGTLMGSAWPDAGAWLLALAGGAAGALDSLCTAAAALPLYREVPRPGWPVTLLLCAGALALLAGGKTRKPLLGLVALALACALVGPRLASGPPPQELTFLDVGQGDSTFIALPDGGNMLVDGGGDPRGLADPGRRRLLPFLRARGVRSLDWVVATHPHPDHTVGLEAVLEALPVGELWSCWHGEDNMWLERLHQVARRKGVPVARPRLLRRGGVTIRPLWPAGYDGECADPGLSSNDNSVVIRLEYGKAAALLPGDIEADAEALLVRRDPALLRAQLLKAPHHGSATSSSPGLLRAVQPSLAVISCGLQNSFGIPPRRILRRYRRLGIPLARVDLSGAIGVRLERDGTLRWRALMRRGDWRAAPLPRPGAKVLTLSQDGERYQPGRSGVGSGKQHGITGDSQHAYRRRDPRSPEHRQ